MVTLKFCFVNILLAFCCFISLQVYSQSSSYKQPNTAKVNCPNNFITTYISDLDWVSATNGWGPPEIDRRNRSQDQETGSPFPIEDSLNIDGRIYRKGLGVHASSENLTNADPPGTTVSRIVYDLGGNYDWFKSDVGLDFLTSEAASAPFLPSMEFVVRLDNGREFSSGILEQGDPAHTFEIDVAGVQTLELFSLDGGDSKAADHGVWGDARLETCLAPGEGQTIVVTDNNGQGTGTTTWTKENTYILDGRVYVNSGDTLVIEPGTVIKGRSSFDPQDASLLIVARGGYLDARGTAAEPIIFTAERDDVTIQGDVGVFERGLWGGLVILGRARTNRSFLEGQIEGLDNDFRGTYGGSDDSDNSGILTYISIRHGGISIAPDNEINGLTLAAVGSRTRIEHIEVFANQDDGVEWYGGTVNTKWLAMAFCGDDSFDYDEGFRGKGQFWFTIQDDEGDRGGEHDGGTDPETGEPFSIPLIYNATFIGPGNPDDPSQIFTFRDNSGGIYKNSIFSDFSKGVDIEYLATGTHSYDRFLQSELELGNNIFWNIEAGMSGAEIFTIGGDNNPSVISNFASSFNTKNNIYNSPEFNALNMNSRIESQRSLDPRPRLDGLGFATKELATAPNDGFFTRTTYKGAFGTDLWVEGWTALDAYGFLGTGGGGHAGGSPILPDLSFTNVETLPTEVDFEGTLTLDFDIENGGDFPSEESQVRVRLQSGQINALTQPVRFLETTGSTSFEIPVSLVGAAEGPQTLIVEIDPDNSLREKEEGNNTFSHDFTILPVPTPSEADVLVLDLQVVPDSTRPNGSLTISCSIRNRGETDAGTVNISATLGAETLSLSRNSIASVPGESSVPFEANTSVPSDFSEGVFPLTLTLSLAGEINTNNNSAFENITILPTDPDLPIITPNFARFHTMGVGVPTELSISVSNVSLISEVKFFHRPISFPDAAYAEGIIPTQNGDDFQVQISDAETGEIGITYFFEVTTTSGEKILSEPGYTYLRYEGDGLPFPSIRTGSRAIDYQILSIPLNVDQNSFNTIFGNALGDNENESRWRFMQFNGTSTSNFRGSITPGEGYWLLTTSPVSFTTGAGHTVEVTSEDPFSIFLDGVNTQIGNPYNFTVSWSDILAENAIDAGVALKTYEVSGWTRTNVLRPFEGAFVQNNTGITSLDIPVKFNPNVNRVGEKVERPPLDAESWYVSIDLKAGELVHQVSGIGMHPEAHVGFDIRDMQGLPRFDSYLDLNFLEEGHPFPTISENYVQTQESHSWDMEVSSNLNKSISISWDNSYFGENERQLWLEDFQNGLVIDMRKENSYHFSPSEDHSLFRIHYGDYLYVESQVQGHTAQILAPYPNPFSSKLVVPVYLPPVPVVEEIRMSLYNQVGQKVTEVSWKGKDRSSYQLFKWNVESISLTEGLYFYRIQVSNQDFLTEKVGKLYWK